MVFRKLLIQSTSSGMGLQVWFVCPLSPLAQPAKPAHRPNRSERRYPRVSLEEIVAARPEVILLPDEPYAFGARDVAELRELELPAARQGRIHVIDGTLISWYGPRIGRAIRELDRLFFTTR